MWQILWSTSVVRDHCIVCWLLVTRISKYLTQTDHLCPLAVFSPISLIVRQAAINLHALSQSKYLPHYWGPHLFWYQIQVFTSKLLQSRVQNDLMPIIDNLKCSKYTAEKWEVVLTLIILNVYTSFCDSLPLTTSY